MAAGPAGRIGELVADLDAARFTGRDEILALVDAALADRTTASVLLVHGDGGVGKSALLRAIARRSDDTGRPVWTLDGRTIGGDLAELEHRVAEAFDHPEPVVLLDALEHSPALERAMRERIVPRLGVGAVVVLAGRDRPEHGWLADGWEHVARVLPLEPLGRAETRRLLAHHGIVDPERVATITEWSRGLPLAVTVAATAGTNGADGHTDLDALIMDHLVDQSLTHVDRRVLEVAAVAVAVDGPLLDEVVTDLRGTEPHAALRTTTIAESLGDRVALHDTVRRVLRRQLRERAPERHRTLVGRVADHLRDRILDGESELLVELAELIDDPVLRWGLVGDRSSYHVDRVREGDVAEIDAALAGQSWWEADQRFFRDAPDTVVVARDRSGVIAGFSIAMTPDRAPAWADEDEVLATWLADARRRVPDGDVILWRRECDLETLRDPDAESTVTAVLNEAVVRTCGLANPRWFYGDVDRENEAMVQLSAAMGAIHVPSADVVTGDRTSSLHVLDHGTGGFIAAVHGMVHESLGLPTPAPEPPSLTEVIDHVLRSFDDDEVLASSPLAEGPDRASRAESVRVAVRDAAERAFGQGARDVLLRSVLERGYLDPGANHPGAARSLHLSRATYFRRLRDARTRLVREFESGAHTGV
ncbi:hypothetical protein [Actinospongicola halichondriae]|uniref:hypothetical protein n=1 Tax=Actinospongicola halichondriae TaxID=3236844 RepID=UPI003D5D2D0C